MECFKFTGYPLALSKILIFPVNHYSSNVLALMTCHPPSHGEQSLCSALQVMALANTGK
jgi:hypothetical protein